MWIGLFIIIAAAAVTALYLLKSVPRRNAKPAGNLTLADIPAKVANPARYTGVPSVVCWEFVAPNLSTACSFARNHDRIRMPASDCTPLPLADCGSKTCECHYRPIIDSRKGQRRKGSDRRISFRMENNIKAPERRSMTDRRRGNRGWDDEHLR